MKSDNGDKIVQHYRYFALRILLGELNQNNDKQAASFCHLNTDFLPPPSPQPLSHVQPSRRESQRPRLSIASGATPNYIAGLLLVLIFASSLACVQADSGESSAEPSWVAGSYDGRISGRGLLPSSSPTPRPTTDHESQSAGGVVGLNNNSGRSLTAARSPPPPPSRGPPNPPPPTFWRRAPPNPSQPRPPSPPPPFSAPRRPSPQLPTPPPPRPPLQPKPRPPSPIPPRRPPSPPPSPQPPQPPRPSPPKSQPPSPSPPKPPKPPPFQPPTSKPPPPSRPPPPRPPAPRPSPHPPPSPRPSPASPRPSPSAGALSTKDNTETDGPTEPVDASFSPDAPGLPPVQPQPTRPADAPWPPPPASPDVIGRYDQIGTSMMVAVHLMAIPGTDRFFFMERPSGRHPDGSRTIAGFLDLNTRRWTHVQSPDGLFCAGHTFLSTGDLLVVGGHQANAGYPDGMKSIRTFNRSCADLQLRKIREMNWRRWYPTATLLPGGQVLIMGGTQGVGAGTANNPFWEMYDPSTQRTTPYAMRSAYLDSAQQVYYPFNYVLPSGLLFSFCGRSGFILDWRTNTWSQALPRLRGYASTQFPFTGTSVMLGLYPETDYQVEVMLFGGQAERAVRNLSTVASRSVQRLRLSFDPAAGNYSFPDGGWVEEQMSMGRVMGDAVLLPNGKVVVLNGARLGLAGDSGGGADSRADNPVLFAELYDPDLPRGSRFQRLAFTRIPRMYHSTACLTTNGTILVAGCDRCYRYSVDPSWIFEPSETANAEYRLEIFSPPYVFYDAAKPRIDLVQGGVMQYGQPFDIAYSWPAAVTGAAGAGTITRVVLVAPCSCTHSYDMNQRLVGLRILADSTAARQATAAGSRAADGGVLTVAGPPGPTIAPQGMYMLFLLHDDVYSRAVWVRLE